MNRCDYDHPLSTLCTDVDCYHGDKNPVVTLKKSLTLLQQNYNQLSNVSRGIVPYPFVMPDGRRQELESLSQRALGLERLLFQVLSILEKPWIRTPAMRKAINILRYEKL